MKNTVCYLLFFFITKQSLTFCQTEANDCRISCGQPSQNFYHLPADWFVDGPNYIVVFEELGGDPSQVKVVSFDSLSNSTLEGASFCGFAEQDNWIGSSRLVKDGLGRHI